MNELKTPDAIRAHYGEPHPLTIRKELTKLDRHCRRFIEKSPFLVIATADAKGRADASPRGDAPGFVTVANDATLLIPDRRGNNRIDTMMNIVENPNVGLLFLVPGMTETLRVNGRAFVTLESDILAALAVDGKLPRAAIRVEIEGVYFQCGKALIRSHLWDAERHVSRSAFPPFGDVLAEQCELGSDVKAGLAQVLEDDYRDGLY